MAAEGLGVEALQAHRRDALLHRRVAEGVDILRGGALGRDPRSGSSGRSSGCGALTMTSRSIRSGWRKRRQPGDRAAPIVADQGEALEPERVGERDQILDDPVGPVVLDALAACPSRRSRAGRARSTRKSLGQRRRDRAPGAVRFGEAVEEDDRLARPRAPPSATLRVTPVGRAMRVVRQFGHG